jgi:bifunctional non-homologous end joining protein LigD
MKESVSLRFKQGSSDKVYNAELKEMDDGWIVNFSYGRYGKPLRSGTKTAVPVAYKSAKIAYDNLIKAKTAKGYTPDADGTPFTAPQIDEERTDLWPQLLNEVTRDHVPEILELFGGTLAMQFKHDGERRPIRVTDDEIYGSNRRALKVRLPGKIEAALATMRKSSPNGFELDAEDMGDYLQIFDALSFGMQDLRGYTFEKRCQWLRQFELFSLDYNLMDTLVFDIPRYYSRAADILRDIDHAESIGHEGVVLRDPRAQYSIGRPNSGGPCLKIKFWQSVTCFVESNHPTKRSIGLALWDNGVLQSVGNCTVPTNYQIPGPHDLVEIKYMYAYRDGSIYQPQYKGRRTDLESSSAKLSQLKYKEDMV